MFSRFHIETQRSLLGVLFPGRRLMDRARHLRHRLYRRLLRQPPRHRCRHLLPADEEHHQHPHPREFRLFFLSEIVFLFDHHR